MILVSGGYGFIGQYVTRYFLGKGLNVLTIDRAKPVTVWREGAKATYEIWSDLSLPWRVQSAEPIELVIHCAGPSSVAASFKDPQSDYCDSVATTQRLIEWALSQKQLPGIVFLSSAAVYGNSNESINQEDDKLYPLSPYGKHKLQAESLLLEASRKSNMSVAIVRLFSLYGPELRRQVIWDCCKASRTGAALAGNPGSERDFLHVFDAVRLIDVVSRSLDKNFLIVNGGSGQAISIGALGTAIWQLLGKSTGPAFLGQVTPGDPRRLCASIVRALSLGWKPQISLETGLKEYVRWFIDETN